MGENLDIEGRIAVRSPMQWSPQRNGGFTTAAPSRLRRPVVEGPFSPAHINVTDQRADPDSLLSFVALLIRRYRESPEFGWSDFTILDQPHRSVLAHDCRWDDRRMLAVHNLSPERCTVPLKLTDCVPGSRLADLLQEGETELDPDGRVEVAMDGYGYRWLRVMPPGGAGWPEGPRSLDAAARPPPWRSDARSHYETAWSADPPVAPTREVGQASRRAAPRESAAAGLGEVEVGRQDCSRPAVKSGRMHPWSWMDVADGRLLASVGHATGVGHDASAAIDVSSCVQRGTLEVIASRVRPTAPHP